MGQHVDERTARRVSQDLAETKASHCEGGVSSPLAARVRRTRKLRRREADTARNVTEQRSATARGDAEEAQVTREQQSNRKRTEKSGPTADRKERTYSW